MELEVKKRPLEFFGINTEKPTKLKPKNWNQGNGEPQIICPFDKNECFKITKTPPVQIIGSCIAGLPIPDSRGKYEPVIICPKRFLEKNIIFKDISNILYKDLLKDGKIGEIRLYHELGTPAPHNRQIDWTMGIFDKSENLIDYVILEVQSTATGSTGPIVNARDDFFGMSGKKFKDNYEYGTNITMTSKTILEQLLHKSALFSRWKRKMVLVVQNNLLTHFRKQYDFSVFNSPLRLTDDVFVLSYDLKPSTKTENYTIELQEVISSTADNVLRSIFPNPKIIEDTVGHENIFIKKIMERKNESIKLL